MNPTLAGLIASVIWAGSGLLVALVGGIPPLQLLALTWSLSTLVLMVWELINKRSTLGEWNRPISDYAFVFFGITGYVLIYFFAFANGPAFEVNSLNYLWPILLIIFIGLHEKKQFSLSKIAGMGLGFLGCILLLGSQSEGFEFTDIKLGHGLAILGAFIWAAYSSLAKDRSYPASFMIPIYILSTLLCGALYFAFEDWVSPSFVGWTAIFLLCAGRVSMVLWDYGMRHGDRVLLTSVSYFVPLFSALLLFAGGFGAASSMIGLAGFLIVIGCLVVNFDKLKELAKR